MKGSNGAYAWTGNLTVDLPVSGPTVLTGPGFHGGICLDEACYGYGGQAGTVQVIR